MRLSKTKNTWPGRTPARLAVMLLALGGLRPQRAEAFVAQAGAAAMPQEAPAVAVRAPVGPSAEALHVLCGRSLVITSQTRILRVSIADPAVLGMVVVSPTQVLVNGKASGASSLVIWDESGQSQTFDVFVDLDVTEMAGKIHHVLPNEPIQVDVRGGVVTLSGHVSSQAVADRVMAIAQAMVPKKENVVSLLEIPVAPTTGEVLLEVKFAEVDRSTLSQFGASLLSTAPAKNVFTTSTGQYAPPLPQSNATISSTGVPITLSQLLNVFIFRPDINLGAIIQALQQRNLLQILAEPNVLAETGKEASFLAGGQFPFPVIQGSTGGVPVVTIQFQPYGVRLVFTPVITPDGLIHLKVAPEVSSLDYTNALTIQGFTIPSISSRRVESEMILKDGQSFVIAGLVNNQVIEQLSKIPGLGDVPLLGKLFRSHSTSKSQDELLVMVTPHIVHVASTVKPPSLPNFPEPFLPPLPKAKGTPEGRK
jgi:pilus assembly protein CpaC